MPVIVHGRLDGRHVHGRRRRGQARQQLPGREPGAHRRGRSRRGGLPRGRRMIAASLNLALGNAGLMLMLAAMTFGALSTAFSIRTGNTRTLRLAPRYAWLGLAGAVLAVVTMQRALITRDFSLAYVQQVGSTHDATALQRGRDVELARGVDPAVGDRARRVHGGRRLALPTAYRRSPRRLGARRDVRRLRVLRARQLRARIAVPERPARCSRRSRSEPAAAEPRPRVVPPTDPVPRATSGSRCRSRSRSRP